MFDVNAVKVCGSMYATCTSGRGRLLCVQQQQLRVDKRRTQCAVAGRVCAANNSFASFASHTSLDRRVQQDSFSFQVHLKDFLSLSFI